MKTHKDKYLNRILILADFVSKVKPKQWDFSVWIGNDWEGAPDLSCGTTACAMGWGTAVPQLRRLGLRMVKNNFGPGGSMELHKRDGKKVYDFISIGRELFGLSRAETYHLFVPREPNVTGGTYLGFDEETQKYEYAKRSKTLGPRATNKQWAKHARQFVKDCDAGKRESWGPRYTSEI